MKRTATSVAGRRCGVGLTIGVTACSTTTAATGGGGDVEGPLTVWVMGDSGANFENLVADSGIEVEVVAIPWDRSTRS